MVDQAIEKYEPNDPPAAGAGVNFGFLKPHARRNRLRGELQDNFEVSFPGQNEAKAFDLVSALRCISDCITRANVPAPNDAYIGIRFCCI